VTRRRRLVLALAAAFVAVLLGGPAAWAAALPPDIPTGRDCLNPPVPANPLDGFAYGIDPGPAQPVAGDPFTQGSAATMYDRYGYAGYSLGIFDTPNKLDICQPITIDRDLAAANTWVDLSLAATAITVRLTRLVTDGAFGSVWDPIQQTLTTTIGGRLFLSTIGVTGAAAAIYVLWKRARRGQIAQTAAWAGKTLTILVVATFCMFYAVGVGGAVDRGVSLGFQSAGDVVTSMSGRSGADMVAITMIDHVVYPTWRRTTFGDDKAAADRYAARLWKAGTFTREEQAQINRDPGAAERLIDERREQYKTIMGEIREQHPQTYQLAAGMDTGRQMWEALFSLFVSGAALWFLLLCLVLMLTASAFVRVAIGLFPAIAVAAVFPRLHRLASDLAATVVREIWRAVIAAFAFFAFLVSCVGAIMRSDLPQLLKVVAVLILGRILYLVMRRFKVTPDWRRLPGLPGRRGRDGDHGSDRRRDNTDQTPQDPTGPHPNTPGGAAGTGGEPAEARMRVRRAPAVTATGHVPDLGPLPSVHRPAPASGTTPAPRRVPAPAVAAASKTHPAAAAAVTAAAIYQQRRQITGSTVTPQRLPGAAAQRRVGPPPARRALPAGPTRPNMVTRDGVQRAPRTYDTAAAAGRQPGGPARTAASTAVVQGVVLAGGRGYHSATPNPPRKK
jgi:hypothetical protein